MCFGQRKDLFEEVIRTLSTTSDFNDAEEAIGFIGDDLGRKTASATAILLYGWL